MPQPLSNLVKPGPLNYRAGLPKDKTALCTQAMTVIALWSQIEEATAIILPNLSRGKATPIAAILIAARADSPKKAIRDTLAASLLTPVELTAFNALMVRYEAAYKLRNPLAHWVLGYCPQVPDAIIACNPEDNLRNLAENEDHIDDMLVQISDPEKCHIEDPDKRLSVETTSAITEAFRKVLDKMYAYREADLAGIEKELSELLHMLRAFRIIVRLRILGIEPLRYLSQLVQLFRRLGLPEPTVS